MTKQARRQVLTSLVELDRPLDSVREGLSEFEWDSDEELVVLRPSHLLAIVNAFIQSSVTAADVETWANLVECRDDIALEPLPLISELLFELANPDLTQELTIVRAEEMLQILGEVGSPKAGQVNLGR